MRDKNHPPPPPLITVSTNPQSKVWTYICLTLTIIYFTSFLFILIFMHGLESLERLYLCMHIVVYLVIKNEIHPYLPYLLMWPHKLLNAGNYCGCIKNRNSQQNIWAQKNKSEHFFDRQVQNAIQMISMLILLQPLSAPSENNLYHLLTLHHLLKTPTSMIIVCLTTLR